MVSSESGFELEDIQGLQIDNIVRVIYPIAEDNIEIVLIIEVKSELARRAIASSDRASRSAVHDLFIDLTA